MPLTDGQTEVLARDLHARLEPGSNAGDGVVFPARRVILEHGEAASLPQTPALRQAGGFSGIPRQGT